MSQDFVRESLFTPFRSTKPGGFGVGVYQCREFAREHGGDLEVISSPGSGTTMRLWLPLAAPTVESDGEADGDDGADTDPVPHAAAGR
jgi:signal transduction histidine kinase